MSGKKSILVFLVDDDKMYRQMLQDQLAQNLKVKKEFKTFSTGEECLDHLHLHPDIVVLDYYLNKENAKAKNGIEILQMIKQQFPDTQVIMLSGQDKIAVAVECLKHGAFDYVIKSESAFLRTQNIITNIHNNMHLREMLRLQKIMTRWSFGVVAFIIILIMVLYIFFPQIWSVK